MFSRIAEFGIVTSWLVGMAWLTSREAIPRWFADVPPAAATRSWLEQQGTTFQYGIFHEGGDRCGTAWSVYEVREGTTSRQDVVELRSLPLISGKLHIQADIDFLSETQLDEIDIRIVGLPALVQLKGERQGPLFPFVLKIDMENTQEFVLNAEEAQTVCDTIKPFSALPGLKLGQSWKIQTLNPIAFIHGSGGNRLSSTVVRVTAQEDLTVLGKTQSCLLVEAPDIRAWVEPSGRVVRQEVTLPGLGNLVIHHEPFNEQKFEEVLWTINREWNR